MRIVLFLLFFFVPCVVTLSQQSQPPAGDWQDAFRSWLPADEVSEEYGEETFELLSDLADHPINLNQASRSQLEQLPFLSAQQVEELVAYMDRYRPMRSLSELQMIESLDRPTRRLLSCFVVIGDTLVPRQTMKSVLSRLMQDGHVTLESSFRQPFYKRKGDDSKYLGYPQRHDLRLQFSSRDQLKFGLTAAQDAGEPFFSNRNNLGYDHYSYYFQLRRMGRVEELNLGMYRVQLGMGLVMNSAFYMGKLASLQSLGRSTHALTAYTSRSMADYLRGAAATVSLSSDWRLTAFASWRPIDATLNSDGTVRTIDTDGYHRTESEMEKKNNTHETDFGFSLSWTPSLLHFSSHISLNAVYTSFDRVLVPYQATASSFQSYRKYYPEGSSFFNASLDYGLTSARFSFSGETALNREGALAAIHTASFRVTDQLSLMLLHRYYDERYTSCHARSFSEGGSTQNEHGLYLGATWTPSRKFMLQGYADYAHFPFFRYQVNAPSDALAAFLLARTYYNIGTFEARYRFRIRQRDDIHHVQIVNRYEHRPRLRFSCPVISSNGAGAISLTLQTQVDGALLNSREQTSRGVMVSQQASFRYHSIRLQGYFGWFRSDDYDSRLYQYEPSVLHDFSFPAFYGHGIRYSFMARGDWGRLTFLAKIGTTDFFDRAVISSGLQQIDGSSQTDLLLQILLKVL